ncbi:MAG: hypothetical protein WA737_09675 [Candidatus Acidiferrales bacterium]
MSAHSTNESSRSRAVAPLAAQPAQLASAGRGQRLEMVRETVLVFGVQLVFRCMLFLRRWNY